MPLEAQQDARIGSVLEDRFQIERLLGEGGMGRVYVADELRLRRRCGVKVLLPALMAEPDCVERFLREAQAIAQIRHEGLVTRAVPPVKDPLCLADAVKAAKFAPQLKLGLKIDL